MGHLALMTKLELSGGNQYLRAAAGGRLPGASRDSDPTWTRRRSEVHPPHLVGAQRANKLAHGAIDEKQDEEPQLDGPEVRPHGLVQQLPVSCQQVVGERRAEITGRAKSDSLLSDQEAIRLQVVAGAGFEPATFGL
jgi:hypothetical protein